MVLTIIAKDSTSRVLTYENNSEFVQQIRKEDANLEKSETLYKAVCTIEPNFESFTTKNVSGGAVIKTRRSLPEKLVKKMRVKNSSQTSKELEKEIHSYLKSGQWKGMFGGMVIRSQHSLIRLVA
jgi:hypothetical protein